MRWSIFLVATFSCWRSLASPAESCFSVEVTSAVLLSGADESRCSRLSWESSLESWEAKGLKYVTVALTSRDLKLQRERNGVRE